MEKIKLTANVLFSGGGMQERGIINTGLYDLDVITTSEIDKYAIIAYASVHHNITNTIIENDFNSNPLNKTGDTKQYYVDYLNAKRIGYDFVKHKMPNWERCTTKELHKYWFCCETNKNVGDIMKVKELPYADLWTYSFPCTDISIAGNRQGIKGGLTRSGLVYEVTRLLETSILSNTAPKYLLMENVDALVSKKFKPTFDALLGWFDEHGYNTYWQVMNAKDHGVPQNRKRVFALHIRKDVDNGKFEFPNTYDNGIRLKDILEKNVASKYYLSKEVQDRFHPVENHGENIIGSTAPDFRTIGQRDTVYKQDGHMGSLVATDYKQPKQILEKVDG